MYHVNIKRWMKEEALECHNVTRFMVALATCVQSTHFNHPISNHQYIQVIKISKTSLIDSQNPIINYATTTISFTFKNLRVPLFYCPRQICTIIIKSKSTAMATIFSNDYSI